MTGRLGAMAGELPWVEKYRPSVLADIVGQKEAINRLQSCVKSRSIPNMMFSGPAGVGKTSAAIALAKELYGSEFARNFLELNASVVGNTPILIREKNTIKRTCFDELARDYFNDGENYAFPTDLQTLSLDTNNIVKFMPVSFISRHKVEKIAKIKFEGGEIETSTNHSVIVLDSYGNLSSKQCGELKAGDLLLSFSQEIEAESCAEIDFCRYAPVLANNLRSGLIANPKLKVIIQKQALDKETAWLFGLYLAEGCATLNKKGSSGVSIFTLGYPNEKAIAEKVSRIVEKKFDLKSKFVLGGSGFNRENKTSIQVQIFNTQLAKFFKKNFYGGQKKHKATTKRVPSFIFSAPLEQRIEFLKGYLGDACGEWEKNVRYSSRSQENLIDAAWLARSCGIDSTLFKGELRLIWKSPISPYLKSDLLQAEPFIESFKREGIEVNWRYLLRHSLYSKKSKRTSKQAILEMLSSLPIEKRIKFSKLEKLAASSLFCCIIKSVKFENYNNWVYDFSVPNSEMFFGGTSPVLLHNSDSRGIDVIRGQIKDFARTLAFSADFKIIFLDESDALTSDAQHALRRTMEKYTKTCRFVLSCNYSSRIIEPLQSRCVIFRFRPLQAKEVKERIVEIAEKENLEIGDKALEAMVYVSMGDMRKAVNILQAASALGKKIDEETIFNVSSRAKPQEVKEMILLAIKGKFLEARGLLDKLMYEHGMSGEDVIGQVYREIMEAEEKEIASKAKIALVDVIGEYDFRLVEGAHERLQLEAMLAQFAKFGK